MSLAFRIYDSRLRDTFLSSLAGKYRFYPKITTEFCVIVTCIGNIYFSGKNPKTCVKEDMQVSSVYPHQYYILHKVHKMLSFLSSLPTKHYIMQWIVFCNYVIMKFY